MITEEERRRGMLGGVCMAAGGLPPLLFYGLHPFGMVGLGLLSAGFVISYGAYRFEPTG